MFDTLTGSLFERITRLARARWGLSLTERKFSLVQNRLTSHLRKSGGTIEEWVQRIEKSPSESDMLLFFDILSTNVTSFFRDSTHFDFLERELWTPLARSQRTAAGRKIRFWSAACSTGAEPYSIAMQALELLPPEQRWDVKVIGSDLSSKALAAARAGVFPESQLAGLSPERRKRWLTPSPKSSEPEWSIRPEVRALVEFRQHNLMDPPHAIGGPFDCIMLRNCMIYFDRETREEVVHRMHSMLKPSAWLIVGSAETLSSLKVPFKTTAASIYTKE